MHLRNHCTRQLVRPKPWYLTIRDTVSCCKNAEVLFYPLPPDIGEENIPLFEGYQDSIVGPSEYSSFKMKMLL
jgi:hypothetical protein